MLSDLLFGWSQRLNAQVGQVQGRKAHLLIDSRTAHRSNPTLPQEKHGGFIPTTK